MDIKRLTSNIYFQLFFLLVLIYFVIFLKLGAFHMRFWDESMFAVNTYEMMHNGNYFSNYFNGLPDICNTKPPLTAWTQILFVKLFGYNELSLRLPSAISAAMVILIVFIFIYKRFSPIWAWISALIILTSSGFINFHTARTAEADSLLTLFLLLVNLFFIKFITTDKKENIIFFFLFMTLAFATKMFAALLFTPAYFVALLIFKKFKDFVFSKYFIFGLLMFLIVNIGLIALRVHYYPAYLHDIFTHDAARVFIEIDKHKEIFSYYIDNFFQYRYITWFAFLIFGFVFVFISKLEKEKKLLSILSLLTVTYFLIISFSITKAPWYDMPLYPYMAMIAAYPIYFVINWFLISKPARPNLKVILIIFVLFAYPYYMMFGQSQANSLNPYEQEKEASEHFIFKKNSENVNLNGTKIFYTGWSGSLLFYKYKLHEANQNIELVTSADFDINDKVLVSNDSLKHIVNDRYSYKILDKYDNAELIQIETKINDISNQ